MRAKPDEAEDAGLQHVHLNLEAMLPGIASDLRKGAERRLQQEHPWVWLAQPALALFVIGGLTATDFLGVRSLCLIIVVGGVLVAVFLSWRKARLDHYLRQRLAGQARCGECGYRLSGISSIRCPECGSRVRLGDEMEP